MNGSMKTKKTRSDVVAKYCRAAITAKQLLTDKVGMAGYRDMNLYGTLYDGMSLKKTTGVEIETFELLEVQPEGKKRMDISSFLNGYKPSAGTVLG